LRDLGRAERAYDRSIRHFDQMRAALVTRESKEVFQEERLAVFGRAARLELELAARDPARRHARWRQAFEIAERAKCQILYEMVHWGAPPAGGNGRKRFVGLEELTEEVLEPGTALLEYENLPDGRLALFAVAARRGLLAEPLLLDQKAAADQVIALRDVQERLDRGLVGLDGSAYHNRLKRTRADYDRTLAELRAAVLPDPVFDALRQADVRRLVVVPDGFLHWVPFHALASPGDHEARYFADDWPVCCTPRRASTPRCAGSPRAGRVAGGWSPAARTTSACRTCTAPTTSTPAARTSPRRSSTKSAAYLAPPAPSCLGRRPTTFYARPARRP
jgi:hypothetical protein